MPQNKYSRKWIFAVAMFTFLILSAQAFSQSENGSLRGTVQDQTKAVIPNAKVTVTHVDTNTLKTTLSNSAGQYSFLSLQPGQYKITVEMAGFNMAESSVKIEIGAQANFPFTLEPFTRKDVVDVVASPTAEALDQSASTGQLFTSEYITNLPTTSNDVMDFVNVIGGVIPASDNLLNAQNQMLMGTQAPGIAVIRDGINVNEVRWSSGINTPSRINPELVQEFKVILSPADAEYGRGAGQIQILTKSGGNAYHGSIVYNAQNHSLDASGWNSRNFANTWRNQHNYTASVSGPIIKQKLFFFVNWDQTIARNRQDVTPIVLTPCARKGIYRYFSGWSSGNAVQATTTGSIFGGLATIATVHADGTPASDTVTMQPDGKTPSTLQMQSAFGELDDNAKALLAQDPVNCSKYDPYANLGISSYWESGTSTPGLRQLADPTVYPTLSRFNAMMPLPNNYGITSTSNSFFASNNSGDGLNTAVAKWTRTDTGTGTVFSAGTSPNRKTINTNLNYNLSDRHRISGNYMIEFSGGADATKLWDETMAGPGYVPSNGRSVRRPQQFGFTITSTVRPTMLNEARVGLARTVSHSYAPLNNPENGDSVQKMLKFLVPTDKYPNYTGLPLIVGLGPEATSMFGGGNPSTFTFSPEGSGTSFSYMSASPASHPYGTKSNSLIPTFGGTDHRWTITDNFTWMHGAHSFRFGGDLRLTRSNQDSDGTQNFFNNALNYPVVFGGFSDYAIPNWQYPTNIGLIGTQQSFNLKPGGGVTNSSTGTYGGMLDLLTYMSGSIGSIRQQYFVNDPFEKRWNDAIGKGELIQIVDMRQKEFSFFAKDDWRVRPNFTVNLGVRWEYYGIPWLANGMTTGLQGGGLSMFGVTGRGIGSWLPAINSAQSVTVRADGSPIQLDNSYLTKQIFIGPNSPNPGAVVYNQDYNNFGPAVGFSWNLPWFGRGRTVLRSGYQLSYRAVGNASGQGFGASMGNVPGTSYSQIYRGSTSDPYISVANLGDHVPANKFLDPSIVPLDVMKIQNHTVNYTAYDPNIRTPYTQSINLSITRTIKNNITVDLRYVGTLARKGIGDINLNAPNFINNGLIDAFNIARRGGESPLLDQIFKGFQFAQTGNTTEVGKPGGPSGAEILRVKSTFSTDLANGNFASLATNLANLNYDKLVSTRAGVSTPINQRWPDLPNEVKGSILRANGFAENFILANPQMGNATYRSNLTHSNYHSAQAQVQLRPTRGLMFTSTYTFSKNLGDQPGGGGFFGGGGGWTNPLNRSLDYKLSNNRTHQWNNYGMADLPLGANGYFLRGVHNGIIKRVIEGWQFSWTMSMSSGSASQIDGGTNHFYSGATLLDLVPIMDVNLNPNQDLQTGLALAKKLAPSNSNLEWPVGDTQGYYYGKGATAKYAVIADPQCTNGPIAASSTSSTYYKQATCTLKALALASSAISAAEYNKNPSLYAGYYPDVVPDPNGTYGAVVPSKYYKRVLLQNPLPGHQGTFSSFIEGIGSFSLDMGMTKSIMLTEGKSLNIRVNGSNILNHPSPNAPSFAVSSFSYTGFGVTNYKSGNRTFQGNLTIRF
jgi:hypothetical protein